MKRYRLPFNLKLEKYSELNIEEFTDDWKNNQGNRRERLIEIDNNLHIELGKFQTFDIKIEELIDLGMRYSLGKLEFRKMMAKLIDERQKDNTIL